MQKKNNLYFPFFFITLFIVGLYALDNTAFYKQIKDTAFDYIMFWHSDFATSADSQNMRQIVLFDVDEQSYRAWDSPLITPRDKLQALIQTAIDNGAKVIGVDISLSWASDGSMRENSDSPADKAFAEYLQGLNENQAFDAPLIFLTRHYRQPLDNRTTFLETPPNFLDDVLSVENNVFWTSALFKMDEDRVVRRWQLAPLVCQRGQIGVVPSMPLLMTLAHLHSKNQGTRQAAKVIRTFKNQWNIWAKQFRCDEFQGKKLAELCQLKVCPNLTVTLPKKANVNDIDLHDIDLLEGYETEKVIYRFAPPDKPQTMQMNLFEVKSAEAILSGELAIDVAGQMVFIGVTHQDNGDYHPIPIRYKDVSGVYILANAVDTLLRFGQFQPQTNADKVWLIVLIIGMTLVFTFLTTSVAFILSFFLLGILIVWSFYNLHHGIEIDFVLVLLTIQFLQFIYWLVQKGRQVQETLKDCQLGMRTK